MKEKATHLEAIQTALQEFEPIGLKELDRVQLLNRVDTKFIFNINLLPSILRELKKHYYVLEVGGIRLNSYESIYFDTEDHQLYNRHHNGIKNRYKMRYRKYVDSNLSFFEIKFKNNKGRTIKKRVRTSDIGYQFNEDALNLIKESNAGIQPEIFEPSIDINFHRLTLADKNFTERATIDVGLSYVQNGKELVYDALIIAELKQEKVDRRSPLMNTLKTYRINPYKMSKYCLGIVSCFENIKYNRFKKKIRTVQRISTNPS